MFNIEIKSECFGILQKETVTRLCQSNSRALKSKEANENTVAQTDDSYCLL